MSLANQCYPCTTTTLEPAFLEVLSTERISLKNEGLFQTRNTIEEYFPKKERVSLRVLSKFLRVLSGFIEPIGGVLLADWGCSSGRSPP